MKVIWVWLTVAVVSAGCSTTATQDKDRAEDAVKAQCRAFVTACNEKRFADAKAMLAPMGSSVPANFVDSKLTRYAELTFSDPSKMEAVIVCGDQALLIYRDSPANPDSIYFLKHGGKWKILLPLTTYNHWVFNWSPKERTTWEALDGFRDVRLKTTRTDGAARTK